jgi:hypothetical protein
VYKSQLAFGKDFLAGFLRTEPIHFARLSRIDLLETM